jgi:S-adenosylmethionine:tRNA ribosyltransferase-isomerase
MKLSDYLYNLDDSLIADFPPEVRGQSRLLVLDKTSGAINDKAYAKKGGCSSPK